MPQRKHEDDHALCMALAHKLWPYSEIRQISPSQVFVCERDGHEILRINHAQVYDILIAALYVLNGELLTEPWKVELFKDLTEEYGKTRTKVDLLYLALDALIEHAPGELVHKDELRNILTKSRGHG